MYTSDAHSFLWFLAEDKRNIFVCG